MDEKSHLLSAKTVKYTDWVVVLALRECGLQLRDSAGLAPASPLRPPIRGVGRPDCIYAVVSQIINEFFSGSSDIHLDACRKKPFCHDLGEECFLFEAIVPGDWEQEMGHSAPDSRASLVRHTRRMLYASASCGVAARRAKVDLLVTFDRKHLLGKPALAEYVGAEIVTPKHAMRHRKKLDNRPHARSKKAAARGDFGKSHNGV